MVNSSYTLAIEFCSTFRSAGLPSFAHRSGCASFMQLADPFQSLSRGGLLGQSLALAGPGAEHGFANQHLSCEDAGVIRALLANNAVDRRLPVVILHVFLELTLRVGRDLVLERGGGIGVKKRIHERPGCFDALIKGDRSQYRFERAGEYPVAIPVGNPFS